MKHRSIAAALLLLLGAELPLFGAGKFITYEEFGAAGDGKTDDMKAIAAAHAAANEQGLPVKVASGKTYFIKNIKAPAVVQTDTDFGTAKFIIDDTEAFDQRLLPVFLVSTSLKRQTVTKKIPALKIGQKNVGFTPGIPALITLVNDQKRHYIRQGRNQNAGNSQFDVIKVDVNGDLDPAVPVNWDFDHVSKADLYPIDEKPLTLQGGNFLTIANRAPSKYTSFSRNIQVRRSNVTLRNIRHEVTGEGETGAPYSGFINVGLCSDVLVEDCKLTGHKTYYGIGSAGVQVANGTYDISMHKAVNITLRRCTQFNDFRDTKYWGIFASNDCKNITFDHCVLSRFDAHHGAHNVTILDSTLGSSGIAATGQGLLRVERTTVYARNFIPLRTDYGATWDGEIIVKDCTQVGGESFLYAYRKFGHDFGHPCAMPRKITIDGFLCKMDARTKAVKTPYLPYVLIRCKYTPADVAKGGSPYPLVKELNVRNFKSLDGKPVPLSDAPEVFKALKIIGDTERIAR